MPVLGEILNYVTPLPDDPTSAPVMPSPPIPTDSIDFYRHLSPVKSRPKYFKTVFPGAITAEPSYATEAPVNSPYAQRENITVFTLDDIDSPFKTVNAEPPLIDPRDDWQVLPRKPDPQQKTDSFRKIHHLGHINLVNSESNMHDYILKQHITLRPTPSLESQKIPVKSVYNDNKVRKVPISKVHNLSFFLPSRDRKPFSESSYSNIKIEPRPNPSPELSELQQTLFQPASNNSVDYRVIPRVIPPQTNTNTPRDKSQLRKHVTLLNTKTVKNPKPPDMYQVLRLEDPKAHHVLTKEPNPYETVLLRPVPNAKPDAHSTFAHSSKNTHMSGKSYTALDLEQMLNQMEVESVVNKNLGRSADKAPGDAAGLLPRLASCVSLVYND